MSRNQITVRTDAEAVFDVLGWLAREAKSLTGLDMGDMLQGG